MRQSKTHHQMLEEVLFAQLDALLDPSPEAQEAKNKTLKTISSKYGLERSVGKPSRITITSETVVMVPTDNPLYDKVFNGCMTIVLPSIALGYDPKKDYCFYEVCDVKDKLNELAATHVIPKETNLGVNKLLEVFKGRNGFEVRKRADYKQSRLYCAWEIIQSLTGKNKEEVIAEINS